MLMYESSEMGSGDSDLVKSLSRSDSLNSSQSQLSVSSADSQEFVLTFLPYWGHQVGMLCLKCIFMAVSHKFTSTLFS